MSSFCSNCGSKILEGDKFCQNCGLKAVDQTTENIVNNMNIKTDNSNVSMMYRKKKPYWLIPVLLFVGGIFLQVISLVVNLFNVSNGEEVITIGEEVTNNGFGSLISYLGTLSWLLVIPGIIVAFILYKRQEKNLFQTDLMNLINSDITMDEKLLMVYIGNNYKKIKENKFSFSALFLSYFYTLYRKLYMPTIIGMLIMFIISCFSETIGYLLYFIIIFVLGFNFNKWYLAYVKKQLEVIKANNPNKSESELILICQQQGGTSVVMTILIVIIYSIVVSIIG